MRPFQVDRNKYSRHGVRDIYKKEKNYNKTNDNLAKSERLREGFKKWTSYFRANPHRFAEEYLGVRLYLFQKIILYLMFKNSFIMMIAARGLGKSFLMALYAIIHAILYPGALIVVASG